MRLMQFIAVLLMPAALAGCVRLTIAWADLEPSGPPATPDIWELEGVGVAEASSLTASLWENAYAPVIRRQLQEHVYGYLPDASSISVKSRTVVDENAYGGRGQLEEIVLTATATFEGRTVETPPFMINLAVPKDLTGSVPIIISESFTPRWVAMGHEGVSKPEGSEDFMPSGIIRSVLLFVFGRYVGTSPVADILDRGYAFAAMYPGEYVPDEAEGGLAALRSLSEGHAEDRTRWGAIAAWAWGFSRAIDALEEDPRFDKDGFVTYGHSRYGKSALLAAAFDDRVAAAISHQSGTGGASLNKRKKGESVKEITDAYPHWFSEQYAAYAGREDDMPIDQHHLLALAAPRPIFLGNARRDVWSDPNGALKAAIGADPIWKSYDAQSGLQQDSYRSFVPEAVVSLWMRPGTHGVVEEDWPAFLQFMDAHFQ